MQNCFNHMATKLVWDYCMAVFGNLSVNIISKYGRVNQHLIAGSTTLIMSIMFPSTSAIIQSSTLAGLMDYSETYRSVAFVLVTGIFVLVINKSFATVCVDIGGRQGTIGFFANFFTTLIAYLIGLTGVYDFNVTNLMWDESEYMVMNTFVFAGAPFIAAFASASVYFVNKFKHSFFVLVGKFGGYTVVVIFGALWFQALTTDFYINDSKIMITYGQYCILFWHTGCMCGLSDPKRYKQWIKGYSFQNYLIVGYVSGWLRVATMGIANLGGKQGFVSFIACNILMRILEYCNNCYHFDLDVELPMPKLMLEVKEVKEAREKDVELVPTEDKKNLSSERDHIFIRVDDRKETFTEAGTVVYKPVLKKSDNNLSPTPKRGRTLILESEENLIQVVPEKLPLNEHEDNKIEQLKREVIDVTSKLDKILLSLTESELIAETAEANKKKFSEVCIF